MNIAAIKHIIIVPATVETATDPKMMAQLLGQMGHYRGLSLVILLPNPCKPKITETANHLFGAILSDVQSTNSFSQFSYDTPENDELLEPKAAAKAHFEAALRANNPPAEVMALLVEPRLAGIMPGVILIDILGDDGIIPGVSMIIEAGGAATVDCVARNRNVLHPMGTQAWVAQTVVGGRPLRPAI